MVVLNKIYTRTGDDGTTSLGTGERVPKNAPRIWAYGTVDETNAAIGLARLSLAGQPDLDAGLGRIQNDLFDLGADLCVPDRGAPPAWAGADYKPLRITPAQVERLEAEIDAMNAELAPLRSFILPGGSPAAGALHVARTVCRRAERHMADLASDPAEPVSAASLHYINRLSDYLFVASRFVNDRGKADVLWVPGQNR
ncbi:MAG: cob(I)yrinic acid a,c-diamide adenosyltransferase [Hyphomicrobiaceae bacterium]|nr:cob(I)yrinic acid a,c-diamide adenosyltransferase [Hyphomicrobiaceae bacterium]